MHVHRREFLAASLAASAAVAVGALESSAAETTAAATPAADDREYYELRAYRLRAGAPHALLDAYLEQTLLPALAARGLGPVGVFNELEPKDGPTVWVLIPHGSLESVARLAELEGQLPAGEYLSAPTKDAPAFDRIDSWLLRAFAGMPRVVLPALTRERRPRLFELRVYESFSEERARKKVEMFNAGEIPVMREVGLTPVFYGAALAGRDLPHLAYLLCGPDRATHAEHWKAFGAHPEWVRLKSDPQYADAVSKIVSRFLEPAAFSQI